MRWQYKEETHKWINNQEDFITWLNKYDHGPWELVGYHFWNGAMYLLMKRRVTLLERLWKWLTRLLN